MKILIREYQPKDKNDIKKCIAELKNFEKVYDEDYLIGEEAVNNLLNHLLKQRTEKNGKILLLKLIER